MSVLNIRSIEEIKNALRVDQTARHPYLRDYTPLSVLSTLNETYAIQVQYLEQRANAAIESTSVWTASGADLDALVADRGITRQSGLRATGAIRFSTSTPNHPLITIPVGTIVNSISDDGNKIYFETTEEGIIDFGLTNISVDARAVLPGTDGNVPEYSISQMVLYIPGVSRVENLLPFSDGAEGETDEALKERYKYAIDVNGRATLPTLEQKINDLESVRECQIWQKYAGEIETVVDTSLAMTIDTDVIACLRDNMAVGVVSRGKAIAAISLGITTPGIATLEAGKMYIRVESEYIATNELITVGYTNTNGSTTATALFSVPSGSVKGDVVLSNMAENQFAVSVDSIIYVGANSYTILGGIGVYPYLYILPKIVITNITINIKTTSVPDPNLKAKVEQSVTDFLETFHIGDDIEFSDVVQYIYQDYTSTAEFVGIDQILSVHINAGGLGISTFGQTIPMSDDQRVKVGNVVANLS